MVLIALLAVQQLLGAARQFVSYRAIKRIDGWLIGRVYDALHSPVGIGHLQDPTLLDDLALGGGNPTSLTPETPGGGRSDRGRRGPDLLVVLQRF